MKRIRRGARIVLRDPLGRFLMFHFVYDSGPLAGTDYWGLPGGGVEPDESVAEAAVRELREETGVCIGDPGPQVGAGSYDFRLCSGEDVLQEDVYFLLGVGEGFVPGRDGLTPEESLFMNEYRWWTLDELRATGENVMPRNLAEVLGAAGVV